MNLVDDHATEETQAERKDAPVARKDAPMKDATAKPEAPATPEDEGASRPMTIEEAARKGGNTTKQRYGPDFYSRIGRKGGQRVAKERGPEFYSEIGRKGGEARVAQSRKLEQQREPETDEG